MSAPELDLAAIAAAIAEDAPALRARLEPTWRDPDAYEHALFAHLAHLGRAPQSLRGRHYDLYAELVARHRGGRGPALVYPGRSSSGWLELSFAELHEMSGRLATQWLAAGVEAGARVALVLPPGPAALLGILTALRLGAVGSLLPPSGRGFVGRRLAAAPPDFVARRPEDAAWVDGAGPVALPAVPAPGVTSEAASRSHGFEPDAPALEVWSAFAPEAAVPVTARRLFTRLATDALLTLGLAPGTRVAAPDAAPGLTTPALPLAALFAGATWVETDVERLAAHPLPIERVAVGPALRDLALAGRIPLEGCARWWLSPADPHDWAPWRAFGEALAARGARGQSLLVSSGFGGALLFGPPRVHPGLEALPAPGWAWVLEEPGAPGQATASPAGILAAPESALPAGSTGRLLLADDGAQLTLGSAGLTGPRGTRLPAREIARVAETHPALDGASLVVTPDPRVPNAVRSVLVVFVDPARDPRPVADALSAQLRARLAADLGRAFVPDEVRAFPLTPRRDPSGEVDAAWCRFQLLTGALDARAKSELHRLSSTLRRWAAARAQEEAPWPSR